jgi:hypothetical protein
MLAAYRTRISSLPFAKSKSRQAIRGVAPESKATTTTYSMSQAMVSCAFVMRRSARANFAGECLPSALNIVAGCGSLLWDSTLLMDYECLMLIMASTSPKRKATGLQVEKRLRRVRQRLPPEPALVTWLPHWSSRVLS